LQEASRIPGAPAWQLEALAGDLLMKGGDRKSSRRMWQQMYEQAELGIVKDNAQVRLQILDALDQADVLAASVREHEERFGRKPAALADLRPAGLLRVPAIDSTGVPFTYDPSSGLVSVSRLSALWRPEVATGARPAAPSGTPSSPPPARPRPQG
jgi:hypothetical protein